MKLLANTILAIALAFTLGQSFALSDTIVGYRLFMEPGDQAVQPATTAAANVTGLDMVRGGGLGPNVGGDSFNSNGWATNAAGAPTIVDAGGYVEIGFEVDPGMSVRLDQLIIGTRSSGSGPAQIGVFTSLDSFANPVFTIGQTAGWPNSGAFGFVNSAIDISSLGSVSGTFAARFMNVGGADTADVTRAGAMDFASTWRITDFLDARGFSETRITGTVVPEPACAYAVFASVLGLASFIGARDRRCR